MRVDEVMTRFPTTVRLGTGARRAAELIAASEVGQLMVLDDADRFVGVLAEGDLLRALLPDAGELRDAGGTVVAGFGVFHEKARRVADLPIDDLMVRDPVTIAPTAEAAAAAVVMTDRGLRRVPVVADGVLLGSVSRIDLCRAVLARAPRGRGGLEPVAPTPSVPAAAPASSAPPATPATTDTTIAPPARAATAIAPPGSIPAPVSPEDAAARVAAARARLDAAAGRLAARRAPQPNGTTPSGTSDG